MKNSEISNNMVDGVQVFSKKDNTAKFFRDKIQDSKNLFSKTSSKVKDNISANIHKKAEETNGFFESVKNKNTKISNLEDCLEIDKSCLVSADKTTSVYKPYYGKLVIIDKDVTGDPYNVTVKEFSKAEVYIVKFDHYTPFVYPNFDEREINGKLFYLDKDQIWYKDVDEMTVLNKTAHTMHTHVIKFKDLPGINDENMEQCIKSYFVIRNSPRIGNLVNENNIRYVDIVRLNDDYMIVKNDGRGYSVYAYNAEKEKYIEVDLSRLPDLSWSSFDIIFKPDLLSFILKNEYPIECFEEKNGFIEYNEFLGKSKVCVFRCEI